MVQPVGMMEWTWVGTQLHWQLHEIRHEKAQPVDCENTALWAAFASHGSVPGWLGSCRARHFVP
jgi:hypothetical protein